MNRRHVSVDWVPLTTSHSRFHDCQSRGNIKHGALRRAKYVFPVGTEINASSGHLAPIIIYRRRGTRASAPISNAKRDKPMRQSFTDTRKSIQRQDRVDTRMSGANNLLILGKGQSGAPPRFYILKKQMHRGRSQLGPLYEVMKQSFQRALPLPKRMQDIHTTVDSTSQCETSSMNSSRPHAIANVTGWTSDGHASDARASTSSADETRGGNIPQRELAHELTHEPNNSKRRRACGACRISKLRCEPDPNIMAGPCKRCRKSGQDCTAAASLKGRQKKIRNRVEAMELKIVALRDTLRTQESNNAMLAVEKSCSASGSEDSDTARSETAAACVCRDSRAFGGNIKYPELVLPPIQPRNNVADIIDRGLLPMETATELFARYNNKMIHHLPAVILPSTVSAAELRKTKPLLFLAIMTASSSEIPNLQRQLVEELRRELARKTIIEGEKSLEIVQALQLAVIWYWLPQMFEEMDFYQLVHMGTTMAIDIGLGREPAVARPVAPSPFGFRADSFRRTVPPDPKTIESRRAWLTCYFLATSSSMTLHRPNLIQWTPFTAECFNILKNSFDAAPTDKYLCHLVWTHHVAEDIVVPFLMDDAIMTPNISDTRSQYTLRAFEHLLEEYTNAIREEVRQRRSHLAGIRQNIMLTRNQQP
ncbi:fungal specific transcription factor [Ilyonectria robusta]